MNENVDAALKAEMFLERLYAGAVYASSRRQRMEISARMIVSRIRDGKIDLAVWILPGYLMKETNAFALKYDRTLSDSVLFCSFQSLSHNAHVFREVLSFVKDKRAMLVIDDGLFIKNVRAVRTARVWAISALCKYRLLVSGAPFEKNLEDMFSQWYALDRRILGYRSYWGFSMNHLKRGKIVNQDYLLRAIKPYSICIDDADKIPKRREYVWQFRLPESVMEEYARVVSRFEKKAQYSQAGVYRMLSACHLVVSGMRITRDFPMKAESMLCSPDDDYRLSALMEVLRRFHGRRTAVLCRYLFEVEKVKCALKQTYGKDSVHSADSKNTDARFWVESLFKEKRISGLDDYELLIYYSQDWSLRKRRTAEIRCAMGNPNAVVVNIVAADTIDVQMVKRVWSKEKGISELYAFLTYGKDK